MSKQMKVFIAVFSIMVTMIGCGVALDDSNEQSQLTQTKGPSAVFTSTQSCRALVSGNYGLCDNDDCRGLVMRQYSRCTSGDCKAMVLHQYGNCSTGNCRAVVLGTIGYCTNGICRAIVTRNLGQCFAP